MVVRWLCLFKVSDVRIYPHIVIDYLFELFKSPFINR